MRLKETLRPSRSISQTWLTHGDKDLEYQSHDKEAKSTCRYEEDIQLFLAGLYPTSRR